MDDLIPRAAAIDAALDGADDWDGGYSPERERCIREHMAKVPAVDAIPMEWLKEQIAEVQDSLWASLIKSVMNQWQKEQEAR